MPPARYLQIAVPTPLRRCFDYRPPEALTEAQIEALQPGQRLQVPFGHQQVTGVLTAVTTHTDFLPEQVKPALALLDETPALPQELLNLIFWATEYYQSPIGEALQTALPALLRQGEPARLRGETLWRLTTTGKGLPEGALKRAAKQAALLAALQERPALSRAELELLGIKRTAVKQLLDKGLIEAFEQQPSPPSPEASPLREQPLHLGEEQQAALAQINTQGFQVSLLDGATGSGKTEVYLQAIARVIATGGQALVLVPEIGLTPQTVQRFQRRFSLPVVALHSGLNDRERLDAWLQARDGSARIIIGTRSAIFTPLANPGILIVDEEHDTSFKQQDGFRYSARDLAVVRASRLNIPLLLGSATPSLESLNNARSGRYQHLRLTQRAGNALPPDILLQDIRSQPLHGGFTQETLEAIRNNLRAGNQTLAFINRRGYAPSLLCHDCGWIAECNHCDARMTVHLSPPHLHCHHCDHHRAIPRRCPACQSSRLDFQGQGTERGEDLLRQHFPEARIIRIDRDSTRGKDSLGKLLREVHAGEPCILVGTQMLAKGHHFPDVTLVVIIDADAGLFSADFRGPERMGQLLLQVAGRAGRAEKPGQVILQSHHTEHPLVQTLMYQGYHTFAKFILQERHSTRMPPFSHLALIRAESKRADNAHQFLQLARSKAEQLLAPGPHLSYLGPLPALMEKRGDRYRYQLQIKSDARPPLQNLLQQLVRLLDQEPLARRVRWSVDVDPSEAG